MISNELQKKIDRAISLLRSYNDPDKPMEIAYSGGKDSDVILQLAREGGVNYKAIYKNTTIDPPGTIRHVRQMGVDIVYPKESFFELIAHKGFPTRIVRYCCEKLKEYKTEGFDRTVIGVRRSESQARNERYTEPTQCIGTKKNPREAIYPLLDWYDDDIRDYLLDRRIKCAPVYYDEHGNFHVERRLGCMCCPLVSKEKRISEFKEHPTMVKAYIKAGQKFRDNKPNLKRVTDNADVYEWFVREVFFVENKEWNDFKLQFGLFGKPDFKKFLEDYFNVKL